MDGSRFDDVARAFSPPSSRRSFLKTLSGGALAALLARAGLEDAAAACVHLGRRCGNGKKCCAGTKCKGRRCTCPTGQKACRGACVAKDSCCAGDRLETLFVPVNGNPKASATVAEAGESYLLRASGTFANNATRCDAEFCFEPAAPANRFDRCNNSPTGTDLAITVNGANPGWGDFRPDHVYEVATTAAVGGLTFRYSDCDFSGNVGSLTVEIFPCT